MKALNKIFLLICTLANPLFFYAQQSELQFSTPTKLPKAINSPAEESFPVWDPASKTLYFARTYHAKNTGGKYAGQDIWFSQQKEGVFAESKNLKQLNNPGSNVVVGVARNGKRMYLLNHFSSKGLPSAGVSVSEFHDADQKWGEPKPVFVPDLEVSGDFYSALVSTREDYILWSLPVKGDTLNNDLYVSLSANGGETWTAPMNLGTDLNGINDEISPFYDPGLKMLFFSRNSRSAKDNYDIWYTKRLDDSWTNWSTPVRADNALNSGKFDAYFYALPDGTAYFCSNRSDSLADIYQTSFTEVSLKADSLALVNAKPLEPAEREPVLIIETVNNGESRTRSLSSLSKEELLNKETRIRFVYFDYDKYNITAKYIEVLDDVARILDEYPNMTLRIDGHTDDIGSDAYNINLSEQRAAAAKEFLVINGVIPDRIATRGLGERYPYATNLTPEGRALNRRVELFFKEK